MRKLRVVALTALGYGSVFGTLAVSFGLAALAVWLVIAKPRIRTANVAFGLGIVSFGLTRLVLKAMRLPTSALPPEGLELTEANAPGLFRTLRTLERDARLAPMERVLLNEDYNAGMLQLPSWGPFGSRNYLVLGLPLLMSLTEEQAASVVGHELGHASRRHGHVWALAYRQRARWLALNDAIQKSEDFPRSGWFLRKFLGWYAPHFYRETFALSREQEYEADAFGARHTSTAVSGEGLCIGRTGSVRYQSARRAIDHPRRHPAEEPPALWRELGVALKQPHEHAEEILKRELERPPEPDDTHPVLRERLEALGVPPSVPAPIEVSAAEAWFGPHYDEIVDELSARFQLEVGEPWRDTRIAVRRAEKQIDELTGAGVDALDDEQLLELGAAYESAERDAEAVALYRDQLSRRPDEVKLLLRIGRVLVYLGEPEGLRHLDRAVELQPAVAAAALSVGQHLLRSTGDEGRWNVWSRAAQAHEAREQAARAEQEQVRPDDDDRAPR